MMVTAGRSDKKASADDQNIPLLPILVVLVALPAGVCGGTNACMLDTGDCKCEAEDNARCMQLTPTFSAAGRTCRDEVLQSSSQACHTGNVGTEYCKWCNASRCLIRDSPGDGICETNECLLKGLHMLAACPEFWPNITTLGAAVYAEPSKPCTADCADHFLEFYEDVQCWLWLDAAMLCSDVARTNFLSTCEPKPAMQMDANDFADQCRKLTDDWVESTWVFALCVGVVCAGVGFASMKCVRKQQKAKSADRSDRDVTDEIEME